MTALIILIVVLAIVAFYFISVYNTLVTLKNKVQEAWSSIDVMLKKRNDLIPNLIETVKGYAAHERNTLDNASESSELQPGNRSLAVRGGADPDLLFLHPAKCAS